MPGTCREKLAWSIKQRHLSCQKCFEEVKFGDVTGHKHGTITISELGAKIRRPP